MKFDDIIVQLGDFGSYQLRVYFLICMVSVFSAFHSLCPVFITGESDHWCVVPELEPEDCSSWPEITPDVCEDAKKDASIPLQTRKNLAYEYDNCLRYNLTNVPFYPGVHTPDFTNDTLSCEEGWVYDTSQLTRTVISDSAQSRVFLVWHSPFFFAGFLVGSLIFGPLNDIIGRYYTYFITAGLFFASGIAVAFSPNVIAFMIFRFFVGASLIGVFICQFVIVTEFVGPSKRMYTGMGTQFLFSAGYLLLSLLAFLIRDWFILELVISIPIGLLFLVIEESPRWLMTKGKFDESETILANIARVNKSRLPEPVFEEEDKQKILDENRERKPTALDLFRTPTLRWRTLNLMFNWAVNSMVYYGLALSTSDLGSDPYVAFFLSGLVEVPAAIWVVIGIQWLGRKPNLCGMLIFGGVACLATIVIPAGTAKLTVAMLGKFCISGTFNLIYIYTAELYPTVLRGAGMGLCSMSSRISTIASPIILIIGDYWPPLPYIIFGSSAIIAGLLVLLLPETKGQKLPETLEEGENFMTKPNSAGKTSNTYDVTRTNPAFSTEDGKFNNI